MGGLSFLLIVLSLVWIGNGRGPCVPLGGEQMLGPSDPSNYTSWMQSLQNWRKNAIIQNGITESNYNIPQLQWTQTSFIQPQMMAHDRYFYDPVAGQYTVEKYLEDLKTRYGGIDSVLIWPTYPNIGTDNRNQFDLLRSMPLFTEGGVKQMIDKFHSYGVKVLFPYNPWDQGTRPEGVPDYTAIANLWKEIDADGFNGDTMSHIPEDFFQASINVNHPIALEAENEADVTNNLNWQVMGWGYWNYPTIPCVSTFKWLIPKHLTNVCNRWAQNHTDDMQFAFFNGVGFESWKNVWGIWNGMVPRDAEALRRIATILRYFGSAYSSPEWEPHTPVMIQKGAYATKFPIDSTSAVFNIVNRSPNNLTGDNFRIAHVDGRKYYDCYHGVQLYPQSSSGNDVLSFFLEANGYGCIYYSNNQPTTAFLNFLQTMKTMTVQPLEYYSAQWKVLLQQMVPNPPTRNQSETPSGMVKIPSTTFNFVVNGIEIEGGNIPGLDFQYPWDPYPMRYHSHTIDINTFYIDRYPVTNREYKNYLDTSGYRPKQPYNFLKDWVNGSYPAGWDSKPVTWIGIEEAREYCAARNPPARLPNEWEWQYAAQGTDSRLYPWGNTWDQSRVPVTDKGRLMRGPDNVDAHPSGASVFGVYDMTGNVYQWTNEFVDTHTRAASLRGGNYYQPQGSVWYEPQSYRLDQHTKYLLMGPTLDRSGGIGFRCVVDGMYTPPPPCTSSICGSMVAPDLVVDLTTEGALDWSHWGLNNAASYDYKINGGNIKATVIGGSALQYNNNPTSYTWSNGNPDRSISNSPTGIYIAGNSKGFRISVPATTSMQTLRLYVGVWKASGTISAVLSNTVGSYTNTVSNAADAADFCYILKFKANGPGQTLIVTWTQSSGDGNVTLQSATLS